MPTSAETPIGPLSPGGAEADREGRRRIDMDLAIADTPVRQEMMPPDAAGEDGGGMPPAAGKAHRRADGAADG